MNIAACWDPYGATENIKVGVVTEDKGATMRLGAYPCKLVEGTRAREAYGSEIVYERHSKIIKFL